MQTYIIAHYKPLVWIRIQLLVPLTFCVLILYISGGTYSLKSTPNDRFLRKFFHDNFFSLRGFARKPLSKSGRRAAVLRLISQLGYGDFFYPLNAQLKMLISRCKFTIGFRVLKTSIRTMKIFLVVFKAHYKIGIYS